MEEAVQMVDFLVKSLRVYGLELNMRKTKLMSTSVTDTDTTMIETDDGFMELVPAGCMHKYLGRGWSGNLRLRGQAAVGHRTSCAWAKFHALQGSLLNRHVSIKLRLALFDATVSASMTYGLETCPLTTQQLEQVDVTQRKMLRKIAGWTHYEDETWEDSGRRMKRRLETALALSPVATWSCSIRRSKDRLLKRLDADHGPILAKLAHQWSPTACARFNGHSASRPRGRPRCRWHDSIEA
jgi:hypothetical protein